jgi:hypothetical protein
VFRAWRPDPVALGLGRRPQWWATCLASAGGKGWQQWRRVSGLAAAVGNGLDVRQVDARAAE